jgi:dihydrodipicolinate synthase/N-acetylneuraminate lyase
VTANIAPQQMSDLCRLAIAGDTDAARAIQQSLLNVHENMFVEANPIPVKWALAEMGQIGLGIRLPLTVLDQQYHARVRAALVAAGLSK